MLEISEAGYCAEVVPGTIWAMCKRSKAQGIVWGLLWDSGLQDKSRARSGMSDSKIHSRWQVRFFGMLCLQWHYALFPPGIRLWAYGNKVFAGLVTGGGRAPNVLLVLARIVF